jgi:hypothetical protein
LRPIRLLLNQRKTWSERGRSQPPMRSARIRLFEANGRFSIILMRTQLPKYASNNRVQGAAAEHKATVEGSLAYFGTYSVSGTDLLLHIEGSTFPNWTGNDQKRINLAITGDELKYVQPTPSGGGPAAPVIWKRLR